MRGRITIRVQKELAGSITCELKTDSCIEHVETLTYN